MTKDEQIKSLRKQLAESEALAKYLESCINCFFTGDIPNGSNLTQVVLATWGRKRLEFIKKKPALLQAVDLK